MNQDYFIGCFRIQSKNGSCFFGLGDGFGFGVCAVGAAFALGLSVARSSNVLHQLLDGVGVTLGAGVALAMRLKKLVDVFDKSAIGIIFGKFL